MNKILDKLCKKIIVTSDIFAHFSVFIEERRRTWKFIQQSWKSRELLAECWCITLQCTIQWWGEWLLRVGVFFIVIVVQWSEQNMSNTGIIRVQFWLTILTRSFWLFCADYVWSENDKWYLSAGVPGRHGPGWHPTNHGTMLADTTWLKFKAKSNLHTLEEICSNWSKAMSKDFTFSNFSWQELENTTPNVISHCGRHIEHMLELCTHMPEESKGPFTPEIYEARTIVWTFQSTQLVK